MNKPRDGTDCLTKLHHLQMKINRKTVALPGVRNTSFYKSSVNSLGDRAATSEREKTNPTNSLDLTGAIVCINSTFVLKNTKHLTDCGQSGGQGEKQKKL